MAPHIQEKQHVAVLGAGSWGSALALLLQQNGHDVRLWEFDSEVAARYAATRENANFLPGIHMDDSILISSDLKAVLDHAQVVLFVVPSHVLRKVAQDASAYISPGAIVVTCVKGIEKGTALCMSDVLLEAIPSLKKDTLAALSGPSHAEEVSRAVPTVVTVACDNHEVAVSIQSLFMSDVFRVYSSKDLIGVELGGALKNVIAVAAGIADGVGFGDNTKAALMTRGLAEITRLGTAMGADPLTFAGLSGMGDLVVTCMSRHSRNRFLGEEIGKGRTPSEVVESMVQVAEGYRTTASARELASRHGVAMPIADEVYHVLYQGKSPRKAVRDLMTRDPKMEDWG
ncbi:NAD(P)H-dependent glycerol-3-phosphate dehydrogenase [bacterium]|nr:NAD(P)H-dependent glycerol-3-phosphate dehydrogenase [bacterium]